MQKKNNVYEIANKFLARQHSFRFGEECVSSMKKIKEDISDIPFAYYFLASNALELYGKSFMCLRWEKEDNFNFEEINKRAFTFGHDLHRIYHYQGVGEEFLSRAKIKKVDLIEQKGNSKKAYIYHFKFHTEKDEIIVYNVESLRYGVFAKKRNDSIAVWQTKLLDLCESVHNTVLVEVGKFLK